MGFSDFRGFWGTECDMDQNSQIAEHILDISKGLAETTTILRRHIGEQEKLNRRLTELADQNDERLRSLEQWAAVVKATLPTEFLSPRTVEKSINTVDQRLRKVETVLIRWGGVWLVLSVLANMLGPTILTRVLALFGGGQ
jgi:hypothetical protein